jgi:hypothetical protein
MPPAVSIDAGRLFRRLDAGPASVPELAVECGADLRTVWHFVREFEARGMLRRKPLQRLEDLPRIERGAGCFQHTDASNHSGPEKEARTDG